MKEGTIKIDLGSAATPVRLTAPVPLLLPGSITPIISGSRLGVEYSPDLSPGSWIGLGNMHDSDGEMRFIDSAAVRAGRGSGFYRVFLRPPD